MHELGRATLQEVHLLSRSVAIGIFIAVDIGIVSWTR